MLVMVLVLSNLTMKNKTKHVLVYVQSHIKIISHILYMSLAPIYHFTK